jgi:excisionase family DNA binding protein
MADAPAEKRTDFLTSRQLADMLQVSEATVRRLRTSGRIPAIRVTDRIVRYNLRDVRSALARAAKARAEAEGEPRATADGLDEAQMNFAELLAEFESAE